MALAERASAAGSCWTRCWPAAGSHFDIAAEFNSFDFLRGMVLRDKLISFQIGIGAMPDGDGLGLVVRQIDDRDVPRAKLVLGQLRARNLPIPSAKFAEQLVRVLEAMRGNSQPPAASR